MNCDGWLGLEWVNTYDSLTQTIQCAMCTPGSFCWKILLLHPVSVPLYYWCSSSFLDYRWIFMPIKVVGKPGCLFYNENVLRTRLSIILQWKCTMSTIAPNLSLSMINDNNDISFKTHKLSFTVWKTRILFWPLLAHDLLLCLHRLH